jgi:hypothetical protein
MTARRAEDLGEFAILIEELRRAADGILRLRANGRELTPDALGYIKRIVATITPRGNKRSPNYHPERCLLALAYYQHERQRGASALAAKRKVATKLRVGGAAPIDTIDKMLQRARRDPRILKGVKAARRDPRFARRRK